MVDAAVGLRLVEDTQGEDRRPAEEEAEDRQAEERRQEVEGRLLRSRRGLHKTRTRFSSHEVVKEFGMIDTAVLSLFQNVYLTYASKVSWSLLWSKSPVKTHSPSSPFNKIKRNFPFAAFLSTAIKSMNI